MASKIVPSNADFMEFVKIINDMCGVNLAEKQNFLESKFDIFLRKLGIDDFKSFLCKLVRDENWYRQSEKYEDFLSRSKGKNVVLLEIGVGWWKKHYHFFSYYGGSGQNSRLYCIYAGREATVF